jgi:S-adenosylmethionine synthetase
MSIEGVCGKNPVYHVGKLYNILALRIANRLYEITNNYTEVYLLSQSGRELKNPWKVIVKTNAYDDISKIISCIKEELESVELVTQLIVKGRIRLC